MKRLGIRVADSRSDIPVIPGPARKLERRSWRDDVEPAFRIEHVGEREKVVLVRAAPVMEDEQAGWLALCRTLAERQRQLTETTSTGSSRPLSDSLRGSDKRNEPPTPSIVSTLTRISAALAAPPIRAATCTSCPP